MISVFTFPPECPGTVCTLSSVSALSHPVQAAHKVRTLKTIFILSNIPIIPRSHRTLSNATDPPHKKKSQQNCRTFRIPVFEPRRARSTINVCKFVTIRPHSQPYQLFTTKETTEQTSTPSF